MIRLDEANKEKEKVLSERQEDVSSSRRKKRVNYKITNLNTELEKLKSAAPSESTVLKQKPESAETRTANVASAKTSNIECLQDQLDADGQGLCKQAHRTGYRVERVDQAPGYFQKTTVYYAWVMKVGPGTWPGGSARISRSSRSHGIAPSESLSLSEKIKYTRLSDIETFPGHHEAKNHRIGTALEGKALIADPIYQYAWFTVPLPGTWPRKLKKISSILRG